jgi:PAS domain S-box-containing protein
MSYENKTKEELFKDLQELRQENVSIKAFYEKEIARSSDAEMKLQISEAQKNAILNGISANIAFVDKELKIIWANKAAADSVKIAPDEMVGHACHHFWADPANPCENCPSIKAFETKKSQCTIQYTPDGRVWEERGEPIFDNEGNLIGVVEIAIDITDRKRDEDELRIKEERYRLLAENSRDVIWTMKLDGTITYISPAVEQLRGFTVEEAMNQTLDEILTPDSQVIVIEYLKKLNAAYASGQPLENFRGENEYYCKDGSTLWAEVIVYPLPADNSTSVTMLGVSRDISERKSAEEALRRSDEMLRETGRMARLGGWELNLKTMALTWSEETYRIHEVEPHVHIWLEDGINFYSPEVRPILQESHDKAINQGLAFDLELPFITAKGNHLWVRYLGNPVVVDGKTERLFGVLQDITERKHGEEALRQSEEKLRELNAQKDKFFSIIAHDLKSPFNTILGFSDILVDQVKEKDFEGIDKYAAIIQQSSKRAFDLLMNLLEWSRAQTGKMDYNPEYFEMVSLIEDTCSLLGANALQKSIAIQKQLPHNLPVFADLYMISAVLRNLISNAIKFTRSGGEIIVSAAETATEIVVSVKDNGVGISKERIEKIFSIGESESTPGTAKEKGTGLGLILCKEFVEKHGGRIWVESAEGKGSTFSFSIPKE